MEQMPARVKRVRYFTGLLLSAADLQAEQDYVRARLRRANLLARGPGRVEGLEVSVDPGARGGPVVVVAPGVAISPRGEELVVGATARVPVRSTASELHVVLDLREEPVEPVPATTSGDAGMEATRVVELATVRLVPRSLARRLGPDALPIARLVKGPRGWCVQAASTSSRSGDTHG